MTSFKREFIDEASLTAFAQQFSEACQPPLMIYFQGQLGAGKTTFIRAMLRQLGITGPIKSPTYALIEPYQVGETHYYHFDLYRLNDPEELAYLGIRDYIHSNAICFVEWPERGEGQLPAPDLLIQLDIQGEGRAFTLQSHSSRGEQVGRSLVEA